MDSRLPTAFPSSEASPKTVTPGASALTSRWPRCSSKGASRASCRSSRAASSTGARFSSAAPLSMREMASISRTRASIRPVTCSERSRYRSRSR